METKISEQRVDHVSLDIEKNLALVSLTHSSEHCIFRVNDLLRKENEKAYEPAIVAIGPYHRDKKNLNSMEQYKFYYLKQFLHIEEESSVDRYIIAMRSLEKRARNCYGDSFNALDKDEFVKMMLLDACFIINFFRKLTFREFHNIDPNDPIIQYGQIRERILEDLILFENQLPFFILDKLVSMTKFQHPENNIMDLARNCLSSLFPSAPNALEASLPDKNGVDHILGLMHKIWCSSFEKQEKQAEKWEFIKCTTELQEAGVKFKKSRQTTISPLDLKFENGVMEIPPLVIDDRTERVFRNLVAFEQRFHYNSMRYITDYRKFLDCLINSAKDVEKLRHKGIIENWLGDDEVVSTMINNLGNQVMLFPENFCYSDIFNNVNRHCRKRRYKWLASLKRNYFDTPWSIASVIAAVVLLLLTLIQTIYSGLSYHK